MLLPTGINLARRAVLIGRRCGGFLCAGLLLGAVTRLPVEAAERHAVFKSVDRGRSWSRSDTGLAGQSRINAFASFEKTLFAGTDAGVFVSRDDGQNWHGAGGALANSVRIISFATVGTEIFAGTDGHGLHKSTDGGVTWQVNRSFPHKKVRCLLGNGGKLYASGDPGGMAASVDGGKTWSPFQIGLPDGAQVFALSVLENRLYAALYGNGVYTWNESGQRWTRAGRLTALALTSVGDTLVGGRNPGGLHWTTDGGATWTAGVAKSPAPTLPFLSESEGDVTSTAPVWELASGDGLVFAGAASGIYYSEDKGRTWERARQGLPSQSPGIAFLIRHDFVLAAATIR